ncbi:MAG TPA: glycosyltransferase family 1 protein [Thermoanaerobaculia bacterium]|jgi:glycosyltransferase involved in cell wall biosynthesis
MRIGIDARKIGDYGIGTYIRGLVGGLLEIGEDELVAFTSANAELPDGVERVIVDAPHYSIRELFAVGRAADRARLDVFHAPHYVVPHTSVPIVVTIHDLIHLHQPQRNPLARPYARFMVRRAVRRAARVLTVSEAVARQLERELGARDVRVTPNAADARLTPGGARRRYFLFAGNDKPHKNADALVRAFARVHRERPDVTLVLAGGAFRRFDGIAGVSTLGFISDDELRELYREAMAVVVPSREEGFGLPALEAMASGAPVITSADAALVELTGDAALHADANDEQSLAAAMLRVADDEALRASMSARGTARARAFTWRRSAEIARAAYREAWNNVERRV